MIHEGTRTVISRNGHAQAILARIADRAKWHLRKPRAATTMDPQGVVQATDASPFMIHLPHRFASLLATLVVLSVAPLSVVAQERADLSKEKPVFGTFGFDESGMNRTILPGDDFYGYANGAWQQRTEIPANRSGYGVFSDLTALSRLRTRQILEDAAKDRESKIGALYTSFMDEGTANKEGIDPILSWLQAIDRADDKRALIAEVALLQRLGVDGLVDVEITPDDRDPARNAARLHQDGLGLPGRDYYSGADPRITAARIAYAGYLAELLEASGGANAQARAKAVLDFETALAAAHWPRVDSRDVDKSYNKWLPSELVARAPGLDWPAYLKGLGLSTQATLLVTEPSALVGEAAAWNNAPLDTLKDWLRLRLIDRYAPYLSQQFVDAQFAFKGTALTGTPENQPRWAGAVRLVSDEMSDDVGKAYVGRYFTPQTKEKADELVRNVVAAFHEQLATATWLSAETRSKALAKLANFKPMIGYPDKWCDYTALTIHANDLVGNIARAEEFRFERKLQKLDKPVDRGEWLMPPMAVTGWANRKLDEIVFAAAMLQPPLFDPNADPAVNYGAAGAIIGHEISHHFDDQGRRYDPDGRLVDWWAPEDVERFSERASRLVAQYSAYEPLPGLHIDGAQTLSENLADLAGLAVSYRAYVLSLGGKPAPVLDGLTGDQRFFLGYAQMSRDKLREGELRQRVLTDDHTPEPWRVDEVRNLDAWYHAFDVRPGQALYLPPLGRIVIW